MGFGDCYMFRIDQLRVVDASFRGNEARYLNHSCDVFYFYRSPIPLALFSPTKTKKSLSSTQTGIFNRDKKSLMTINLKLSLKNYFVHAKAIIAKEGSIDSILIT